MEEFDLDNIEFGATNISSLKSDSDGEFRQIIDNLSDNTFSDMRPKRQMNMNHFVQKLEKDIERFGSEPNIMSGPIPSNMDSRNDVKPSRPYIPGLEKPENNKKKEGFINKIKINKLWNSNTKELLILALLFMILNNSFIITLIYDRIPFMKSYNSPYPNLLLRTILFVLFIYLIKNYIKI
jgi:hypothetical protein